jgi:mRNA interferase MazF
MNQGEIWLIDLDPTVGTEMKKTRPGVIVNDDALGKLPLKVVVPLTDWKDKYKAASWIVKVEVSEDNNLLKPSAADCFQVRSISERRFEKRIGKISESSLGQILAALSRVLTIGV